MLVWINYCGGQNFAKDLRGDNRSKVVPLGSPWARLGVVRVSVEQCSNRKSASVSWRRVAAGRKQGPEIPATTRSPGTHTQNSA
jgi:hypothetical protein